MARDEIIDSGRLKIAGILQILLGWIGIGRLSLIHLTRASAHTCFTLLGLFCLGISQVIPELLSQEPMFLLFLSGKIAPEIYQMVGLGLIGASALVGIIDGVFLLKASSANTSSCCLGFFGWIAMVVVFFAGVGGITTTLLNIDLFMKMTGENVTAEMVTTEHFYDTSITIEGSTAKYIFKSQADVDFLVISYAVVENEEFLAIDYVALQNIEKNKEYTVEFKIDLTLKDKYEVIAAGVVFSEGTATE